MRLSTNAMTQRQECVHPPPPQGLSINVHLVCHYDYMFHAMGRILEKDYPSSPIVCGSVLPPSLPLLS